MFNTWLINRVSGLIITCAIPFNNFDDISSYPHIFCREIVYSFLNNIFINVLERKS